METVTVKTWQEFEDHIKKLESLSVPILFRGQANSNWKLETTLDRFVSSEVELVDYYATILIAKPRIEAFTDKSWDIPNYNDYKEHLNREHDPTFKFTLAINYIAYLRHHGFPSPLLDWTSSPYIAAFFAFNRTNKDIEYVSIYAFLKHIGLGKITSNQDPSIYSIGEYISTHKRHFLQQSQYTICTVEKDNDWYFTRHENVTSKSEKQDILLKFNIPVTERIKVLKILDRFNINSFSLFGSEESLMDMIATKELLIKRRFD